MNVIHSKPVPFLTDPGVAEATCGVLRAMGVRKQDLQDGVHDVYVKVLAALSKGSAAPADVDAMRALCVTVAKNHMIDETEKAATAKKYLAGPCEPDEYTPLEYGVEMRDPVDAGRQLEVLAQLFREGAMPEHGVDILEGVASRCTHKEIAGELGIEVRAVERRLAVMRRTFRARMTKLGILPGVQPLHRIVSEPGAIAVLRRTA